MPVDLVGGEPDPPPLARRTVVPYLGSTPTTEEPDTMNASQTRSTRKRAPGWWTSVAIVSTLAALAIGGPLLVYRTAGNADDRAASCAQAITAANEISKRSRYNWKDGQALLDAGRISETGDEASKAKAATTIQQIDQRISANEDRLEALQGTYTTHRKDCTR